MDNTQYMWPLSKKKKKKKEKKKKSKNMWISGESITFSFMVTLSCDSIAISTKYSIKVL